MSYSENEQSEHQFYNEPEAKPRWRRVVFGFWILCLVGVLFGAGTLLVYKTGFTYNQIKTDDLEAILNGEAVATPTPQSGRINILLLGLRGEDDPNGGLLTDTIMILSIKESTGEVGLISIPRDLYVTMPGQNVKEKINYAYALGFEKKGAAGALLYSKIVISQVTGLYMNYAVSIDHRAFQDIVDALGGVDIYLDKPFEEYAQWVQGGDTGSSPFFVVKTMTNEQGAKAQRWVFHVPAGTSHLDGVSALYFARARYSSSDFDRARRQQLLASAIKNKAFSLGVLANPLKIYQLLESLGKNVRTDMPFTKMTQFVSLAKEIDLQKVVNRVFDTTPEGLLYAGKTESGAYILLPVGDNFSQVQKACREIFENPSSSSSPYQKQ